MSDLMELISYGVLPIYEWRTPASEIKPQEKWPFRIIKKGVPAGKYLPMEGVMGYEEALFINPATITVLQEWSDEYGTWITWASDTPFEYYSMWEMVSRTEGPNVLVAGLGLGILANLLSLRRDIKKITVVEISREVIEMVKPYLSGPIEVIHGDFLKVGRELSWKERYDSVLIDIFVGDERFVEKDEELFESVCMLLDDFFPDARHIFWGEFQKKYDAERTEEYLRHKLYSRK